jgi:hypothetical protein
MCGYDFAGGLGHAGGAPPATLLGEGGKRLLAENTKFIKARMSRMTTATATKSNSQGPVAEDGTEGRGYVRTQGRLIVYSCSPTCVSSIVQCKHGSNPSKEGSVITLSLGTAAHPLLNNQTHYEDRKYGTQKS